MDQHSIPKTPFKLLIFASRPYAGWAILAFLCVFSVSVISTSVPYFYKQIINSLEVVQGGNTHSVWFWTFTYIAVYFFASILWRVSGLVTSYWATGIRKRTREVLTEYVIGHSYNFFSNNFAGALNTKISQASSGIYDLQGSILWQWTGFATELAVSLYLVFTTNILIAWIFIIWILVVTPINIFLYRKKIPIGKASTKAETELNAVTIDMLSNMSAVRDYARDRFELSHINQLIKITKDLRVKNWRFSEIALLINSLFETVFAGGMIIGAIYLFTIRRITAGDVVMIVTLISALRKSIGQLGQQFNSFADNVSTIQESLDGLLHQREVVDVGHAQELGVVRGEILFKNVAFTYSKREVFKNLNFVVRPGERVGLVGKSGAGKSTIMRLLSRQYDLQAGEILIDDQNIALVTQQSLREAIATVPQEPLLFHRTIRENIAYGNPTASEEEVSAAAQQAQAHHFITQADNGYDSLVGERGIKLSGGEKQRIAIARAFLKKSKILLLDEATSALDSESEILIQQALEKLMEGKTVIAIAHRLSTLRAMDRIIVLSEGQVAEDGSHDELLKKGGIYAELWNHQAGGFIPED